MSHGQEVLTKDEVEDMVGRAPDSALHYCRMLVKELGASHEALRVAGLTRTRQYDDLRQRAEALEKELAATQKAKAENDDRFQIEAETQRQRAEAAEKQLATVKLR